MNDTRGRNAKPATWTQLALHAGGRSLIEASAGTGKTWTISVLYLRLLLEEEHGARQIIVTTFTDAAAQELRERIRARLVWVERLAHAALARNDAAICGEADADWLHARWRSSGGGIATAAINADLTRLRLAEAELDLAPIGTLHSLCRRILADHPFESGSAFALGNPVPPDAINAELADDLWRRLGQSGDALTDADRVWWQSGRDELEKYLRLVLAPGVGVETIALASIDEVMQPAGAETLRKWIATAPFSRANSKLRKRLETLAQFIANGDPCAKLSPDLAAVLAEPLENHLRASAIAVASRSEALVLARRAAAVLPRVGDALRSRALSRYRDELRAQRRQRLVQSGAMTFDDLIERVNEALRSTSGSVLADALFATWPIALIDEFQDTDALQYAILDRIYRDGAGSQRGRLVMIGDPKQAIYRFRGGDIDAYLEARKTATSQLALDVNFRSSRQYVGALNAFYAHAGAILSTDAQHEIACTPVRDSGCRDAEPYRVDGAACDTPLQFHYWNADVPEKSDRRTAAALEACANQIVELLSGRHTIGARSVQPGDIAVLLPTGRQIARLRELLRERAVPCVSTAWSSVFASDWARELQVILYAALHPREDGAVRAALATRLGGATYERLRELRDEPDAWQRETDVFSGLDRLWHARGALALVQRLAAAAAPRLFAGDEGERAMTDLRHLGELLQARSEEIAGREELLTWLADERERAGEVGDAAADERQLRIESDAARVRLMTLHASKGLEFPIVMLPLMWDNKFNSWQDTIAVVHDSATRQRVVTFGEDGRRRYRQEGQDERFRLLYVALTRARYACHVYALPPQRPKDSKSNKAEIDPFRAPLDAMLERLLQGKEAPPAMDHVSWSPGPWLWKEAKHRPMQAARAQRHVLAEPPAPRFESSWSFSALASGADAGAREDDAASDEAGVAAAEPGEPDAGGAGPASPAAEPEHAELAWLAPVAGTEFGNALHAIFEHRALGRPMYEQHALIERSLHDAGVGRRGIIALDELVPHLADRVQATLDTPLLPGDRTLTLGALPAHALCSEMPFEFRLGEVSLRRLREVCDFVPPTSRHTLLGLMSGKIDLVFEHAGRFHVLDYKSNRLGTGTRLSEYAPAALVPAMDAHHYRFQALLYTIALDRYLRQRVAGYRRATHLGAAIYLFVRAVGIAPDGAADAGIWTQRFDDTLIDAVDDVLAGATRDAA
jgi:exodeoxyribonuclease V beta subunit